MGVVVGAAQHFESTISPVDFYCESGFAFALNIAPDLCPSGPYVWAHEAILQNLRHLGLKMKHVTLRKGFPNRSDAIVHAMRVVREAVLSVEALEHQLVTFADEEGLALSMPWGPEGDACLKTVSLKELQQEDSPVFGFYRIDKCNESNKRARVLKGLECALEMNNQSTNFQLDGYDFGPQGYTTWANALRSERFNAQGSWWNSQVWSECRQVASDYFKNWMWPQCDETRALAQVFSDVSRLLGEAGNRELASKRRAELVLQAAEVEATAANLLRCLLAQLRKKPPSD